MFALAEKLGRTVGELENTISAREVSEWLAFLEIRSEEAKPESERPSYTAAEMRARFERLKAAQREGGRRILERQG